MRSLRGVFAVAVFCVLGWSAVQADEVSGRVVKVYFEPEQVSVAHGDVTVKKSNGTYVKVLLLKQDVGSLLGVTDKKAMNSLNVCMLGNYVKFSQVDADPAKKSNFFFSRDSYLYTAEWWGGALPQPSESWKRVISVTSGWEEELGPQYGWLVAKAKSGKYTVYWIPTQTQGGNNPLTKTRAYALLNLGALGRAIKVTKSAYLGKTELGSWSRSVHKGTLVEVR